MTLFWIASGFWIAAGVLAGAAALLVMLTARRAATAGSEDAALRLHRRQLAEIDDLSERGLLNDQDKAAVRAEAARRLIVADAARVAPEQMGDRRSRFAAATAVLAAAFIALGLYFVFGAPGAPDQPYKARVAQWRTEPSSLDAPRLAAVMRELVAMRPNDPAGYGFLGRAELAADDPYAARKAFARAIALAPDHADLNVGLGQALDAQAASMAPEEAAPIRAEAEAAFRKALAIDATSQDALFALGQMEIEDGRRAAGLGRWRTLSTTLATNDPRRPALDAAVARVAAGGPITPPAPAQAAGGSINTGAEGAFIRGMVASLAAKLKANPDDPAGWARLVRAYGVLHDASAQADALAKARKEFAARPDEMKPIEAEAAAHPAG
jgi:cytochrome c-type biogenesis protein CcmH